MATSPSDQNNRNIIAWLDRLQASVRAGGVGPSEPAFKLDSRAKTEEESEPESAGEDDYDRGDFDDATRDSDNLQALPDAAVPLGLIANLSLSNTKAKASSHNGDVASTDTLDDDNVVCWESCLDIFFRLLTWFLSIRVSRTRLISCQDLLRISAFVPCSLSSTVRQRFWYTV